MFPGSVAELGNEGEAVLLGIEWSGEKLAYVHLSPHYFPRELGYVPSVPGFPIPAGWWSHKLGSSRTVGHPPSESRKNAAIGDRWLPRRGKNPRRRTPRA
jgi:hypothetical protein